MRFQDMTAGLSDQFLLLYQSELQHFWLKCTEELEIVQTLFFHQVLTELTHTVKYGQKYEYVHRDTGYDYSIFSEPSSEHFQPEDYQLLGDFLTEPSGDTRPTFESGTGMHALSWEDALQERWDDLTGGILFQGRPEAWEDCLELEEFLGLWQLELSEAMLNKLKDVPFYWMLEAYASAAEELKASQEQQALLQSRMAEVKAQIADEVHSAARKLLPRDKYGMEEQAILMAGLSQLAQSFQELDFQIYLKSEPFALLCSQKLAIRAQQFFKPVY